MRIQAFSQNPSSDCTVLFHELHGERAIEEAHKHDFLIAILFERGAGTHTIDFVAHPIQSNQLHLLFPGQVHAWNIQHDTVGYQLMIGQELLDVFLTNLRFAAAFYHRHPVMDIPGSTFGHLLYEFKSIQQELHADKPFTQMISARLGVIGLLISRVAAALFQDTDIYSANPVLSRFVNLIDQHFREQRSVAFYAAAIGISANYLNMICKKELHVAASSLIQDRVLLEAKRLLKASRMTVKEIVFDLGFYDHANFSKFFKAHTGMTPSEFK
nr:AraC family transcriptional regulator [Chitinophaga rhizophila]